MTYPAFTQPLHRHAQLIPDRTLSIFGDRRVDWRQCRDRVSLLAGALQKLGLQRGDRVGILSLNSDRYLEAQFAIVWAGGVLNPCNIRWTIDEIAYSLNDCTTGILIVDDMFVPMADDLRRRVAGLRHLVHSGETPTPAGMLAYEDLIGDAAPVADARRGGDDLLGILYTGGTTGYPKGVMTTHGGFWSAAMSLLAEGLLERDVSALRCAPMFHIADMFYGYCLILLRCVQVIQPSFQPAQVAAAVARHKIDVMMLVPTMIQLLLSDRGIDAYDFSTVRHLWYGASAISERTQLEAMRRWPQMQLTQVYGQTELSPIATVLRHQHHADAKLRGSAGQAALCVELRIGDFAGKALPCGEIGEILARGPNVMKGYWNQPEQSAAAITAEGWLRTGDVGWMDDQGFLTVVDRVKDMIVTGGENVFSAEVENALASHPGVAQCAVIGIPNWQWGETVHAAVVLRPGHTASAAALIAHCRDRIAGYKCPTSVAIQDSLPLSGAGKVLKRVLREPFWRDHDRGVG